MLDWIISCLFSSPRWDEWKSGNNSAARFVMHLSKQLVVYMKQMFEQKNIIENQSTSSCGKSQEMRLFLTGSCCLFFSQDYRIKSACEWGHIVNTDI